MKARKLIVCKINLNQINKYTSICIQRNETKRCVLTSYLFSARLEGKISKSHADEETRRDATRRAENRTEEKRAINAERLR